MTSANTLPILIFTKSLFTSRIFWTQVLGVAAIVATAAGAHPSFLSADAQAEIAGGLVVLFTTVFRVTGDNGPVSVTAPLSTPDSIQVPPGTHTLTVTAAPVVSTPPATATLTPVAPPPAPPVPPAQGV